jgi:hypothetical protein
MREAAAITMGFFSGILVFVVAELLFARNGDPYRILAAFGCFVVATIVSALWMLSGTKRVSLIFRKGFLLGAVEWIAIIAAEVAIKVRTPALRIGVPLGISTVMAVTCLIGYTVAYVIGRNKKSSGSEGVASA